MNPNTSKSFPCNVPRKTCYSPFKKSVINQTVVFKPFLRFIATRRRLWQFTEWGSLFMSLRRWSSAWWFLSTEGKSASGFDEKGDPHVYSAAGVCNQPDNSRTPERIAAKRRQHFHRIWSIPSDISPTKKKIHTTRLFPFRVWLRKSRTATLCLRTPDSFL